MWVAILVMVTRLMLVCVPSELHPPLLEIAMTKKVGGTVFCRVHLTLNLTEMFTLIMESINVRKLNRRLGEPPVRSLNGFLPIPARTILVVVTLTPMEFLP